MRLSMSVWMNECIDWMVSHCSHLAVDSFVAAIVNECFYHYSISAAAAVVVIADGDTTVAAEGYATVITTIAVVAAITPAVTTDDAIATSAVELAVDDSFTHLRERVIVQSQQLD